MSTLRLFSSASRLATARLLSDGSVFQVYPTKQTFPSQTDWQAQWPSDTRLEAKAPPTSRRSARPPPGVSRRNFEIMEFFDPSYTNTIGDLIVKRTPDPVVCITMPDGTLWEIKRSLDFMKAPILLKNGEDVGAQFEHEFSPALTSVRWWMMIAFR
jgi:hypothetical protein